MNGTGDRFVSTEGGSAESSGEVNNGGQNFEGINEEGHLSDNANAYSTNYLHTTAGVDPVHAETPDDVGRHRTPEWRAVSTPPIRESVKRIPDPR